MLGGEFHFLAIQREPRETAGLLIVNHPGEEDAQRPALLRRQQVRIDAGLADRGRALRQSHGPARCGRYPERLFAGRAMLASEKP